MSPFLQYFTPILMLLTGVVLPIVLVRYNSSVNRKRDIERAAENKTLADEQAKQARLINATTENSAAQKQTLESWNELQQKSFELARDLAERVKDTEKAAADANKEALAAQRALLLLEQKVADCERREEGHKTLVGQLQKQVADLLSRLTLLEEQAALHSATVSDLQNKLLQAETAKL